jgi:hypothetical protein
VLDSQGYLWLFYDLVELIKLIGETFAKNTLCHSLRIIVIPSILLSFLPYYSHSFQIIVIPNSSQFPLIPERQENWPAEPAIFANY